MKKRILANVLATLILVELGRCNLDLVHFLRGRELNYRITEGYE